jgi:hypothetical protein
VNIYCSLSSIGWGFLACLPLSLVAAPPGERMAVQNTLYGLQELRTVIPERLWQEEFALLVDTKAFEEVASQTKESSIWDSRFEPTVEIGPSEYYFLYAATTGETIRLDDRYLQFLNSPYWNAPEVVRQLYYLQRNYMKVAR